MNAILSPNCSQNKPNTKTRKKEGIKQLKKKNIRQGKHGDLSQGMIFSIRRELYGSLTSTEESTA